MQSRQKNRKWAWTFALSGALVAASLAIAHTSGQPPYSQGGAPGTAGTPTGGPEGGAPGASPTASPEASPGASPTASPSVSPVVQGDIVDVALQNGFNTFVQAVRAAGLEETLRSEGPFTVFAPTDEAFSKVAPETLNRVLADQNLLRQVLLYHVVAGELSSQQLTASASQVTQEGEAVEITTGPDGGVLINDARVVQPDLAASNGVIQGVDSVLVPPALAAAGNASPSPSGSPSAAPSASPSP